MFLSVLSLTLAVTLSYTHTHTHVRSGVLEDAEGSAEVGLGQADQELPQQGSGCPRPLPLTAVQEGHHPLEGVLHVALGVGLRSWRDRGQEAGHVQHGALPLIPSYMNVTGRKHCDSTHAFHEQAELVKVAELLQILKCQIQFTQCLVHNGFHGDQVVAQELQAWDVSLLPQTHQRQGAVHLRAAETRCNSPLYLRG